MSNSLEQYGQRISADDLDSVNPDTRISNEDLKEMVVEVEGFEPHTTTKTLKKQRIDGWLLMTGSLSILAALGLIGLSFYTQPKAPPAPSPIPRPSQVTRPTELPVYLGKLNINLPSRHPSVFNNP